LADQIGNDIITTDRHQPCSAPTTRRPCRNHGCGAVPDSKSARSNTAPIKILFTPDEEIGRGVDKADLKKLGADLPTPSTAKPRATSRNETFSADAATISIEGVSTPSRFCQRQNGARDQDRRRHSSIRLPKNTCSPETTEGKQGFLHPIGISGALEKATLGFIVRDFTDEGLKEKEALLEGIVKRGDEGVSALNLPAGDQAAVPQHEADDRPSPRNHLQRHGGDPPHRP